MESPAVPEIYASGIGAIEILEDGARCIVFTRNRRDVSERRVVLRLIVLPGSLPDVLLMLGQAGAEFAVVLS